MKKKRKQVKQRKDKDGFLFVVLEKNGDREVQYTHILVAKAFVPNPEGKENVRHKDGDKENNRADNLEWY